MCGARDLPVIDVAAEVRVAPENSPAAYTVATHRSYRCPCGWEAWTSEVVTAWKPGTVWIRKLAVDESKTQGVGRTV